MFHASTSAWQQESPLKVLISRATYPSQPEPNYALNLEVAEYINQKKANSPREAAMTIAQLVNHRNPHVAMLALALLDTLVQSCGYPFHLQIATKEFLNELVRRFPERPPPYPGPVMSRILELIHGWKEGICTESRWKDDLGNIRDMHRLLTFKGYRFRDIPRPQAASAVTSNLKTAEELENEDREAQSAKLQELIRRGTPRDLAQAQELMKALAGANPDAKPDYKTQALTELNKLEAKVILLNEMLDNVDTDSGERFAQGDVYDQVASILTSARPKIQGWISNAETEDPESLDTFLQINDQINSVINRYEAFKKGDYAAAANPIPAELSRQQNDLSLIDFDDSTQDAPFSQLPTSGAPGSGIDELATLFGPSTTAPNTSLQPQSPFSMGNMGNTPFMQTQAQSMFSSPQPMQPAMGAGFNTGMGANMGMSSPQNLANHAVSPQYASVSPAGTPPSGSIRLPGTPQAQGAVRLGSPAPNYFPAGGMPGNQAGAHAGMGSGGAAGVFAGMGAGSTAGMGRNGASGLGFGGASLTPQTMRPMQSMHAQQQQQSAPTNTTNTTQAQGKDPFADLVGLF